MSTRAYRVRHETCYTYGGDVAHSHHLLHLSPRLRDNQHCLSAKIVLDPPPSFRRDDQDAFGNPVTRLEYDRPHQRLSVCAEIDVTVSAGNSGLQEAGDPWESVVDRLRYSGKPMDAADADAVRFRMQSGYVVLKQALAEYADDCFTPGTSMAVAAGAAPALVGADASHAWVSVYCPPLGWIDLDPTNDVRVGTDHITLAWGRDFGDVSPLRGVIVGGGRHDFSVRVTVQALDTETVRS